MRNEYGESVQLKFSAIPVTEFSLPVHNLHFNTHINIILLLFLRCLRWCTQPVQFC